MIGPETEKSYGYEPAHGFGCGQTLDTDRLLDVDRHFRYTQTLGCGQTFRICTWTLGCGQTFGLNRVSLPFPCLFLLSVFVNK